MIGFLKVCCITVVFAILAFIALMSISPLDPIAVELTPNPGLTGVFAANQALSSVKLLAAGKALGAEDVALGPDGDLYTGLEDGRIVRVSEQGDVVDFVNTGGRPLGMQFDADGFLIVADAYKGLLSISAQGTLEVLADKVNGQPMKFVDDLDIAADGTIWFSDASMRFDYDNHVYDFFDGRPTGRLLSYDPQSKEIKVHKRHLMFANGVAVGPQGAFVLVNETGLGRIHRLWLHGEKAGQQDIFYDGLPCGPDNLSFNGHDTFWVACPFVRKPFVDVLTKSPLLRRVLSVVPPHMLMPQDKDAMVLGLDVNGQVTHNLQSTSGRFHTITSVNQYGETLYLGSLKMNGVGRFALP